MRRLRTDAAGAEDSYQDLLRGVDRARLKFAARRCGRGQSGSLRASPWNPEGELRPRPRSSRRVEEVIDNRLMRKLDESDFIDRAYAAQGVRP